MKFKGWIITGLFSVGAFGASALGVTSVSENQDVNEALQTLKNSTVSNNQTAWPELVKFQNSLWKSMALDPGPVTVIPIKLVPKELYAEELTTDLNQQLEVLKSSNLPKSMNASAEYEQYLSTVRKIIAHRISRQFPQARAYAKRGTLDEHYQALAKKIQGKPNTDAVSAKAEALATIENHIKSSKETQAVDTKKNPFTNGNQFIWATIIALIGFAFGLTAIKMNPEFFEKFIAAKVKEQFTDRTAPAATHTHRLNYARWLREFEELLAKLKTTQLTHERRIEEVYKHSEKLNQFANALCSDPRIKNEANLEFRMSNLMRELHQQLEQTNELKTGDRAQIHVTLEHCLKLCDAIENNGVEYHHDQIGHPPQNNPNMRTG